MGIRLSFPLKKPPICYYDRVEYIATGKQKTEEGEAPNTRSPLQETSEQFFASFHLARRRMLKAGRKFEDIPTEVLLHRFPQWDEEDIWELKAEFQTFDFNQDGILDFNELTELLDTMGDDSSEGLRLLGLRAINFKDSQGIDFEQFLQYVYNIIKKTENTQLQVMQVQSKEKNRTLQKLHFFQQVDYGLL
ncbi:uncharacterized protein LOC106179995 [Lingula anatina]|uniref:Uncharacterized protein LOC106179995 n=1 Tax=Lingula anatina TaxID=7574 RepID=A0A1S3KAK4_LINAN|nr:uncharacterized protein LOC106179995 [Lingula anatina]|eukprot:XP_013419291.1 uncharacterized protein LOC106179995 [Lingula anatina]